MSGQTKGKGDSPYMRVALFIKNELAGIDRATRINEGDFVELRVKARGEGDFLAVVKRIGEDGGPEVLFGVGVDFVSALLAASKLIEAGKWRADKPWKAEGK